MITTTINELRVLKFSGSLERKLSKNHIAFIEQSKFEGP